VAGAKQGKYSGVRTDRAKRHDKRKVVQQLQTDKLSRSSSIEVHSLNRNRKINTQGTGACMYQRIVDTNFEK
jgi:hypothetical protein